MSRFYGSLEGGRGAVTRTGTASSGITAHPRGWNLGIRVSGYDTHANDVFSVNVTGGSTGGRADTHVLTVEALDDGTVQVAFGLEGFEHYYKLDANGDVVEHHPLRQPVRAGEDR